MRRTTILGGVTFECLKPGSWISLDRVLFIQETFGFNKWELYRTQFGTGAVRKPPRQRAKLDDVVFAMHDMLEAQSRMMDLAREIELARDWVYNLSSGFYDAGRSERFYLSLGLPPNCKPTRKKPVDISNRGALWSCDRLPRIKSCR